MNRRLLDHLLKLGFVDEIQLRSAMARQRQFGGDILHVMVEQKMISEETIAQGLASFYRYPIVDFHSVKVEQDALDMLSGEFCRRHEVLSFAFDRETDDLMVALVDPAQVVTVVDAIRFKTGKKVRPFVAARSMLKAQIEHHYFGAPDPLKAPAPKAPQPGSQRPSAPRMDDGDDQVFETGGQLFEYLERSQQGRPATLPPQPVQREAPQPGRTATMRRTPEAPVASRPVTTPPPPVTREPAPAPPRTAPPPGQSTSPWKPAPLTPTPATDAPFARESKPPSSSSSSSDLFGSSSNVFQAGRPGSDRVPKYGFSTPIPEAKADFLNPPAGKGGSENLEDQLSKLGDDIQRIERSLLLEISLLRNLTNLLIEEGVISRERYQEMMKKLR